VHDAVIFYKAYKLQKRGERITKSEDMDVDFIRIDPTERTFSMWASVEIRDNHGDFVPISTFKRAMPVFIKRGGPVIDNHTNRAVGHITDYEFSEKELKDGTTKPGMIVSGFIHTDYVADDEVWDRIQNGNTEGASIGGNAINWTFSCDDSLCERRLDEIQLYEITIASETAKIVNPEATITDFNNTAKSAEVPHIYVPVNSVFNALSNSVPKTLNSRGALV